VSATGALAAVFLAGAPAAAQWAPPPPEYIATTEPVYFEGHASYWYGNHWVWRDEHGAWAHYDHEPPFLAGPTSRSSDTPGRTEAGASQAPSRARALTRPGRARGPRRLPAPQCVEARCSRRIRS
jgi:hypothetical protein